MKILSIFVIFCLFLFNSYKVNSEDSLTVKQQLDRLMEEVRDLNKAVFNRSFNNEDLNLDEKENDIERFASIDIRIYDLEKDIKNLTLQYEEILFKLDDISNNMNNIETELSKIQLIKDDLKTNNNISNIDDKPAQSQNNKENTLGTIVISDNINENSNYTESKKSKIDEENSLQKNEVINLSPEEQLQYALNQMMKKNYNNSKKILEDFLLKFPDNQLSGSAHFWLGKIYLFESNYRKAAIIFGEGVQKFPKSIKSAEMYYELAKSLKAMNKYPEACKTLELLNKNHEENKFTKDPEKIKKDLNCEIQD
tara:strand:- start:13651 stop:14580 length:930 start_codon:yes stop_codon:yes gene_type:complete